MKEVEWQRQPLTVYRNYKCTDGVWTAVNSCRTSLQSGSCSLPNMKGSLIVFCCLVAALAAEDKISLEDIERDNLHNEKITKLTKTSPSSSFSQSPKLPQPSPAQYGFVPLKTVQDYVQKEPTGQYLYNQEFFASRHNKPQTVSPQHMQLLQQYQQVLLKQQELKQLQQQQFLRQQQQARQLQPQKYVATQQFVVPQVQDQQYVIPQQYLLQPQAHQKYILPNQAAYRQNVQYVTDNHITTQPKQYYSGTAPQYYYLQQYTQPSNTIQTVVDPKGGVQYVMYVPAVVPATTAVPTPQAYENVVYVNPAQYATQAYQQQAAVPEYAQQYVQQPQIGQLQLVQKPQAPLTQSRRAHPKNLLDSYIPSHLQLQYLKQQQQQAQANVLRQSPKQSAAAVGKGERVKSIYREQEQQGQPSESETAVDYEYQLPYYQPGIPRH